MKIEKQKVSSQLLILLLAGILLGLMIQVAKAAPGQKVNSFNIQNYTQAYQLRRSTSDSSNVVRFDLQQKSLAQRIIDNTTLTYYHQFLGPTLDGNMNETYNVFQEGYNAPGTGRAPLQSFHAVNLRYNINSDWAVGASLAAVNGYTEEVENNQGVVNRPANEFFNARAYVALPTASFDAGTLSSTFSYEAPTSVISRNDGMTWGWVLAENWTFKSPSIKWTYGITAQYYRAYFRHEKNVKPPKGPGFAPTQLQTVIVSGGPYANYRFNDKWMLGSAITLDWDQRGVQTESREYNNNLPHRGRVGMTYFPTQFKYLASVGVFAQALLKFRPETTAVGADFLMRF